MSTVFEAAGVAEPIQRATIATKLFAYVVEVPVQEGDRVMAGQIIVRLDTREVVARGQQTEASLASAQAIYEEALAQTKRIRSLYADSAAPKAQLDAAEAGLARAEAGVHSASAAAAEVSAMADYTTLSAPFAGIVVQRFVDAGTVATPGAPILLRLRISVSAAPEAVEHIQRGMQVQGTVAGQAVVGTVEGIVSAPGGNLVTVNALIDNPDGNLFGGSAATLSLPQGTRSAVMVPSAAVVRQGDLTGLYVKQGDRTDLRWVRLGSTHKLEVEVLAGLAVGDTVVIPIPSGAGR
jgi:RND family efflux transporter MFP subunit